jgi:hypothetical protein
MEQSPSWEANWFAARQEIPRVLWNPKVPHRTHKRPPPIPIPSQPNPFLTPTSHFLKIHPNTGTVAKMIVNETRIFQNHPEIKRHSVMAKPQRLRRPKIASISKEKSSLSVRQAIPRPILKNSITSHINPLRNIPFCSCKTNFSEWFTRVFRLILPAIFYRPARRGA